MSDEEYDDVYWDESEDGFKQDDLVRSAKELIDILTSEHRCLFLRNFDNYDSFLIRNKRGFFNILLYKESESLVGWKAPSGMSFEKICKLTSST